MRAGQSSAVTASGTTRIRSATRSSVKDWTVASQRMSPVRGSSAARTLRVTATGLRRSTTTVPTAADTINTAAAIEAAIAELHGCAAGSRTTAIHCSTPSDPLVSPAIAARKLPANHPTRRSVSMRAGFSTNASVPPSTTRARLSSPTRMDSLVTSPGRRPGAGGCDTNP
jgi:hypothetical protein